MATPFRLVLLKALVSRKNQPACDNPACDAPGCDCHDDHAFWCHVSGPNRLLHAARICCNCEKMHLIDDNGLPIIRKSLHNPFGLDFGTPIIKSTDGDASTHKPPHSGPTERWITVHPNGDGHDGHPIKIVENHDGSWTVSGGAGGKLNGLRLTGVKSHEEYKEHAKQKASEKRAKKAEEKTQNKQALHEKHAATVREETAKAGQTLSEPQVQKEAARRAQLEYSQNEQKRADAVRELQQQKHDHEKQLIESVAKAQGWQSHEYSLDNDALGKVRDAVARKIREEYPGASGDEFHERMEKAVERVQKAHHAKALARAREVLDNARELVVAAHDNITADTLGDVKVGDLVKDTLGDGGKGYTVNLHQQALERGMDIPAAQAQAADLSWQGFVDRNDGDLEAAAKAAEFVSKLHNGAAKAREQIKEIQEELGAAGEPLAPLASLDTLPKAKSVKEAADLLSKAKELDAQIKAAQQGAKEAKDTTDLDTLPTTAVIQTGAELSHEEAREQVLHDLSEVRRQKATEHLMALYNAQDATAPIRSHRLSGHNAFFSNVGHLAGVRAPDPLMADILGESATAHVMRRAFENTVGHDNAMREGLKNAMAEHHIATQVGIANEAARDAEELFNAAENIEDIPLDSVDGLMAGLDQNEKRLGLVRAGREKLGVAVGRLEAAAALNEAFMGKPRGEVQVALGAISLQDAVARAHALGLSDPDHRTFDGQVQHEGEYHIFNDGKNKILLLREKGLDTLAAQLAEDPHHLDRAKEIEKIKTGAQDENGWLPKGFSSRPELDVSGGDGLVIPDSSLQLNLDGASTPDEMKQRVRDHIAQRIEAGQDPIQIATDLNTAAFRAAHVPNEMEPQFRSTLAELAPQFKRESGTKPQHGEHKAHQDALRETLVGHHAAWLDEQVQSGKLSSAEASVHRQTLSHDWETRDLLYQVALQDPRLQHAFHDTGALDRHGKKAVRDYAYQHIFNLDPKKHTEPITPLSDQERKAWDGWQKLTSEHLDPYQAIQQHWKEKDESEGGGMFGPAEPHEFATLDLSDDRAVVEAARRQAQTLGYTSERRVLDVKAGKYEDVVPELEETPERALSSVAGDARRRIKAALRDHAHQNMFGAADVAGTGFNPENVHTAGQRWAEYVKDMGGEQRALRTVQEKMRGDFAARFAKGHKQWKGADFQTVAVPLTHSQAHARASLSPEKRAVLDAQKSSEAAKVRDRAGGKFAAEGEGAVASKLEAKEQAQLLGGALFNAEETKTEKEKLDTHRLSLGAHAEGMVRSLMPRLNLKRGTVAAGDINMSSGDGIKRQRAIKQVLAAKRHALTLSAGAGKTAVSLAVHSELRAKNPNHRTLMAVPSAVQEQFASEAARFYDMTQPNAPMWHADSSASPEERRASYHPDSGYDVNVVTHQALRDDLTWALAQHKFGGDEENAREYLATAPETERNQAIKAACAAQGWRHDMTTIDEGHGLLNRAGKENSAMANAIDGYTHDKEYHVPMTADIVKNDASEAFDALKKVAPQRFVNDDHPLATHPRISRPGIVTRGEFLRKYNVNTSAAMESLQKEMAPYHYAESIKPPVAKHERVHIEKLTPDQQQEHNRVLTTYRQAREARRRGGVDVKAIQSLSPNAFAGAPESEHEAIARRLQGSLGMIRDSALDRVVNNHPNGAKMQKLEKLLRDKPPSEHPHLVFAHSLEAVDALHDHLKAKGYRVGKIKGDMNGAQKEEQKLKFSPQYDAKAKRFVSDPEYDILIASDCASTGANLQRASEVTHYDTPHTAMTYQQRGHRAHRTGQWRDVTINHLSTDTKYERSRRERLEKKNGLREGLTTPAEHLDDSGLALRIARETDLARAQMLGNATAATQSAPRATLGDTNNQGPKNQGPTNQGDGSDQNEYSNAA